MERFQHIDRRDFLKGLGQTGALVGVSPFCCVAADILSGARPSGMLWVEAQAFADKGGWVVDQQFMDQMGAPYLMAHGMGNPVEDAVEKIRPPGKGTYRVWVRACNWTARWSSEAAGTFQLFVEGTPLQKVFGKGSEGWLWEDGGVVSVESDQIELRLRDLTGFDGRCDAIIFTKDLGFVPPNDHETLKAFRRAALGLPDKAPLAGSYDLVVVGGGAGGVTCAISAARMGMRTALINDRPVLGGNNSTEVSVPAQALLCLPPYPKVGVVGKDVAITHADIVAGYQKTNGQVMSIGKMQMVQAEDNLACFLNMHLTNVEMNGDCIRSVTCQHIENSTEHRFTSPLFVDATGDGNLGFLAGAQFRMGREAKSAHNEPLAPEKADNMKNGTTNQWGASERKEKQEFPDCPWAIPLNEEMFLPEFKKKVKFFPGYTTHSHWYWQNGWEQDTVNEGERIRDYNLLGAFSYWAFIKKKSKRRNEFSNWSLNRLDYINGRRESRRIMGDHILTEHDVRNKNKYDDAFVYGSYMIDMHLAPSKPYFPHGDFFLGKHVNSLSDRDPSRTYVGHNMDPYPIPYRCLYSRNISNMMMVGRCLSASHIAHSSARLIHTTTMMGEVVAMGAALCHNYDAPPRDVANKHLEKLRRIAERGIS